MLNKYYRTHSSQTNKNTSIHLSLPFGLSIVNIMNMSMISSNTPNGNSASEQNHRFSIEREMNAIREGRVPWMPITLPGANKWYFSPECIASIIDTFIQEDDHKSSESLAALFTYIHMILTTGLSDEHAQYLVACCDENLSNTCVVVCMLSLQLSIWFLKDKDIIHDFLVRLTLYHHENHACWASSLAAVWNKFIVCKQYGEKFATSLCESSLFASAFVDLLQCEVETKYSYWSDFPEFVLFDQKESAPEKYCFEILRYIFLELNYDPQYVQMHNVIKRYIPFMYDEEGNIQRYNIIIRNLTNETKTKSAKKRYVHK
jgi:hypothetical protein